MKYNHYHISDFVADDFFVRWVKDADPETEYFWQNWLENHPEKAKEVQQARDIVLSVKYLTTVQPTHDEFVEVLENIHRHSGKASPSHFWQQSTQYWWKYAASLALLLMAAVFFYQRYNLPDQKATPPLSDETKIRVTKSTDKGQKLNLTLPDCTKVKLNAESTLQLPEKFGKNKREVYLTGEAFFEVAEDTARPFVIYSGDLVTTVLGTSFNIKAYPDDTEMKVAVAGGKVMVRNKAFDALMDKADTVFLLPNHLLIFKKDLQENLVKRNVDIRSEISWKDGVLIYEEVGLKKIVKDLERWYGVEIEISKEINSAGKYSGTFDNKALENVLQGLSFTSAGFHYRIEGTKVTIYP